MRVGRHLTSWRRIRWAVFVALLLLACWPTQALAAGTFDLQAAINACPAGGTVSIPAGTFTFSSQVSLKSGVTLKGAGVDQTILTMPAQVAYTNLLAGGGVSNAAIRDLTIQCQASTDKVLGIHLWNYSNVTIERVKTVNCHNGLKTDTRGSGLVVRNLTSRGDRVPLYISNASGAVFNALDLANSASVSIYVAASNNNLSFDGVNISRPGSWGIQLWYDAGWATPSDAINLANFNINANSCMAIGRGYTNVTVSGLTLTSTSSECIRLWDPRDVLIQNFTCSGGPYMLGTADDPTVPNALRVTLRNGSYSRTPVVEPAIKVSGLVLENVGASGSTTTTAAPSTTTTRPTTTTTSTTTPVVSTTTTTSSTTSTTTRLTTTTTAPAPSASVTLTPTDGSTVSKGNVSVKATISSPARATQVLFYVDGKLIARDSYAPFSITWKTSQLTSGSVHQLNAFAYSGTGAFLGSAASNVTIGASTTTTTLYGAGTWSWLFRY